MDKIIFLLLFAEFGYAADKVAPKTRYEYSEKSITARIVDSTRSKDLETAVKELMNELSTLEGEFQKAELSYKQISQADSYFEITLDSAQSQAALRDLVLVVDDVVLYESRPGTTLAMDNAPLFAGSLPPGKHDISIGAKAMPASHGSLSEGAVYTVSFKESVDVPPGKVRKRLVLNVEDPKANKVIMRSEAL
ncbi:MAG: hypothetical protein AB7T49_13565 [Oligoflexales bacterium]